MRKRRVVWISSSDPGDCRIENEDRLFVASAKLGHHRVALFAVADGCGGMQRGAEASALAVECVRLFWEQYIPKICRRFLCRTAKIDAALEQLLQIAHEKVCRLADETMHPASTLSVLLLIDKRFWIRHVGDSRVYRLPVTRMEMERLTEDQSMVEDMLRNHEIAPWEAADYSRSILSMCLGVRKKLHTYSKQGQVDPGDIFLLCSDGLYAYAPEDSIAHQLRENPSDAAALRNLIPFGQAGDNVSFIIAWEEP